MLVSLSLPSIQTSLWERSPGLGTGCWVLSVLVLYELVVTLPFCAFLYESRFLVFLIGKLVSSLVPLIASAPWSSGSRVVKGRPGSVGRCQSHLVLTAAASLVWTRGLKDAFNFHSWVPWSSPPIFNVKERERTWTRMGRRDKRKEGGRNWEKRRRKRKNKEKGKTVIMDSSPQHKIKGVRDFGTVYWIQASINCVGSVWSLTFSFFKYLSEF